MGHVQAVAQDRAEAAAREVILDLLPVERAIAALGEDGQVEQLAQPHQADVVAPILQLGVQDVVDDLMVGRERPEPRGPDGGRQGRRERLVRGQKRRADY